MGQNVYSLRAAYGANGMERGGSASPKSKITLIKGLLQKVESHTRTQFVLTLQTRQGQKMLKIGEANMLDLEKGKAYLFSCRPNTGVGDGSCAQWVVTKKPEPAILSGPSTNPSFGQRNR